jgi:CheY-like chemotaxis protein
LRAEPDLVNQWLAASGASPGPGKGTTVEKLVLVVDDEAEDRNALMSHLERHGYELMTAATGREALEQIAARCPRAVVLDLGLPDMDAFEVARTIRANSDRCHPALLLIHPADPQDRDVFRGFQFGSDFQGVKHACLDDLTRFLARVFENWERYGRP